MKPYQLIAALMAQEGIGALPLAKRIGDAKLQPKIHRFIHGQVASPSIATAAPLAKHYKIPLEAIYDEKAATAVARERGLSEVPVPAPAQRKRRTADQPFDDDVMRFAAQYAKLSQAERHRFRLLLLAARDGVNPTHIPKAPKDDPPAPRRDASTPVDSFLGDFDSGIGGLDEIPAPPPSRKRGGHR